MDSDEALASVGHGQGMDVSSGPSFLDSVVVLWETMAEL